MPEHTVTERPLASGSETYLALHERWFLIGVAALPIMQVGAVRVSGHALIAADAVFAVTALTWLWAVLRRRASLRRSWFYVPAAAYLVACMLSAAFSRNPRQSAVSLVIDFYVVALALLTLNVLNRTRMLRPFAAAWVVGTAVTAAAGVAGVLLFYAGVRDGNPLIADFGSLPAGNYTRVPGLFLDFNMGCNYLSVGFLLLLMMRARKWVGRGTFLLCAALAAVAALFTVSPGLGGLLLGVGLWLWCTWSAERRPLLARCALLGGILAAVAFTWAMMVSPNDLADGGLPAVVLHPKPSARWACWNTAVRTLREHPAFGLGAGVPMPCPPWVTPYGRTVYLTDAHNTYLNVAALKGMTGLAAFVALLTWLARRTRFRLQDADPIALFTVALSIAFVQAVLYQGFSASFEHTRHLWVLMGALAADPQ